MDSNDSITRFGKRIQRCYGCFIAYHLEDMYLGEDVTFFCEHCKNETMFHFDEFSKLVDIARLGGDVNLTIGRDSEVATGQLVSGNYYSTLGVRPAAGRLLLDIDDRTGLGGP